MKSFFKKHHHIDVIWQRDMKQFQRTISKRYKLSWGLTGVNITIVILSKRHDFAELIKMLR